MTTLKEFEDALRDQNMHYALAVLERLRERDKARRSITPARRVTGRKMTPDLAREILELHETTKMTQQEIAFRLGVNQGRVNEVIKRGKWLTDDPAAPEALARDKALERADRGIGTQPRPARAATASRRAAAAKPVALARPGRPTSQLSLGDF